MGKVKYLYDETVFENIDTKEKAYIHGFLSADAYINKTITLELSIKDEYILIKLKDFFKVKSIHGDNIIKYRSKDKDEWHSKDREYNYCSIQICSKKLSDDFYKHLNSRKKSEIRLPIFDKEDITLSWIKGYYDGNGSENSPRIASPSKLLLDDIKKFMSITYNTSLHHKNTYVLYIGAKALYDLTINFSYGLERKNKTKVNEKQCITHKNLDFLTYDILSYLVKTHSQAEIGKMFDITRPSVFTKCKSLGIHIPKRANNRYTRNNVKTECEFYPCHNCEFKSCEWCYCILYNYDCEGNYSILENGIKDCSNCCIPHTNPDYIEEKYNQLKKHNKLIELHK